MKRNRTANSDKAFRVCVVMAGLSLCFYVGCGLLGGGSTATNGNGNGDNGNINGNGTPNGNDNGNANDNGNVNDNVNDNGGGGGNDNGTPNGNDNTTPNGNGSGNINDNGNANTNGNTNGNANTNDNGNVNGNGNTNANNNGNTNANNNGGGGGGGTQATLVGTKSSGSAQPGELVQLTIDVVLAADCLSNATWTQTAGDDVSASLTMNTATGAATFTAPSVSTTTTLSFSLSIPACSSLANGGTGSESVRVQVALVTLTLPDTVVVGGSVDLNAAALITGQPADAPTLFQPLFFVLEPVPQGVSINLTTSTLMVDGTGVPGQTIEVNVLVIGSAGILASDTDTVLIVAAP